MLNGTITDENEFFFALFFLMFYTNKKKITYFFFVKTLNVIDIRNHHYQLKLIIQFYFIILPL